MKKIKVVNLSSRGVIGSAFNGYKLHPYLKVFGVDSHQLTFFDRKSNKKFVSQVFKYPGSRLLARVFSFLEKIFSVNALLHPHSWLLLRNKFVKKADILHLHIIYDGWFSLNALPYISRKITTVWTWHDPYPMTGHCVHPLECDRFKVGCGSCPSLDTHFSMKVDKSYEEFLRKSMIYKNSKIHIIVASNWMMRMAEASPLAKNFNIHLIPFGVDLSFYKPGNKIDARKKYKIDESDVVIFIRARNGKFKGFDDFKKALEILDESFNLTIITAEGLGYLDEFRSRFKVIELGWTNDENLLLNAYTACDFFVMNSKAEAFGLMAVEAMACGRTVLCADGTSLPEVTFSPEVGVCAKKDDIKDLARQINFLASNKNECERRGKLAREKALNHYDIRLQAKAVADLYKTILAGRD